MTENCKTIHVLLVDDEEKMAEQIQDGFERFNRGEYPPLPNGVEPPYPIRFESKWCSDADELGEFLKGKPRWDVYVLDRLFHGTSQEEIMLKSLNDLHVEGLRIVLTALPELFNAVECMRLGAWDYLAKHDPRHGNYVTDVIVSILDGFRKRKEQNEKADQDRKAQEYLIIQYGAIYARHKGHFIAMGRNAQGEWDLETIVQDESLYGLYLQLEKDFAPDERQQRYICQIEQ